MENRDEKYYDDLLKRKIGEALRERGEDEKLDRETLERWEKERDRKDCPREPQKNKKE